MGFQNTVGINLRFITASGNVFIDLFHDFCRIIMETSVGHHAYLELPSTWEREFRQSFFSDNKPVNVSSLQGMSQNMRLMLGMGGREEKLAVCVCLYIEIMKKES